MDEGNACCKEHKDRMSGAQCLEVWLLAEQHFRRILIAEEGVPSAQRDLCTGSYKYRSIADKGKGA